MMLDATSSGLNKHLFKPKYHLITRLEVIRKLTRGAYLAKADLKNGFLQLPVRVVERTYLGFFHPFKQTFCVFVRLSFGVASAAFLF